MGKRSSKTLAQRLDALESKVVEQVSQPVLVISGYDADKKPAVLFVGGPGWRLDGEDARAWGEANPDPQDSEPASP